MRPFIKAHAAAIITIFLFLIIGVLIIQLVARVTRFSKGVTDFYAPTIHEVKSFAEAINHLQMGIEKEGLPDEMAVVQLQETTQRLKTLSTGWDPRYRQHIEAMIVKGERLAFNLKEKKISGQPLLDDTRSLNEEAQRHVRLHAAELEGARTGIQGSALKIQLVVLALLVIGVVVSFREAQIQRLREQEKEKLSAIKAFVTALEARDPYTKGHSLRVAEYVQVIGKEMGMSKKMREQINLAALLHDIGKIAVPDAILRKNGPLNDEEWALMKKHPVVTARILEDFELLDEIKAWALYHHERFDGKGYPEGKSGKEIPLAAQILAIADSFDAMTTDRPYRPGMTMDEARMEIEKNKGHQWPSEIVEAFLSCVRNGLIKILS